MKASQADESRALTLAARLRARIRREGAISFRDWMKAALYDEREGYYCRRDAQPWGRAGDYRTSPERSPLFAATFAGYFAQLYTELGSPGAWTILEAGAGAGDFAEGVLEILSDRYPQVFKATRYLIDEVSDAAVERLRLRLSTYADHVGFVRSDEIVEPFDAGLIFSNELLDALPVHRVVFRAGKLHELCVGLNEADEFIWAEREPESVQLASYLEESGVRLCEGQMAEVNLAATEWLCRAAAMLGRGYLISVDYGAEAALLYDPESRRAGTLRAFAQHRFKDNLLDEPGTHDLTTTVNWTALQRAGAGCGLETLSLEPQDRFLLRAGLLEQLEHLTASTPSEAAALALRTGARELILPGGMSQSFQVLIQQRVTT
ncbi:MAG: SAM-dependent methyltransferase [Acidobacteria bacterium]|nr:SAM-dependent methyltransferase [Acidobacteriota bacterium]